MQGRLRWLRFLYISNMEVLYYDFNSGGEIKTQIFDDSLTPNDWKIQLSGVIILAYHNVSMNIIVFNNQVPDIMIGNTLRYILANYKSKIITIKSHSFKSEDIHDYIKHRDKLDDFLSQLGISFT